MAQPHILDVKPTYWACTDCPERLTTHNPEPHTPLHPCLSERMKGLSVPFQEVPSETAEPTGRQRIVMRDDKPDTISSVITDRPDGSNDATVFPETATITVAGQDSPG